MLRFPCKSLTIKERKGRDLNPREYVKGNDFPRVALNGAVSLVVVIFVALICYDVTVALWRRFTKNLMAPIGG